MLHTSIKTRTTTRIKGFLPSGEFIKIYYHISRMSYAMDVHTKQTGGCSKYKYHQLSYAYEEKQIPDAILRKASRIMQTDVDIFRHTLHHYRYTWDEIKNDI